MFSIFKIGAYNHSMDFEIMLYGARQNIRISPKHDTNKPKIPTIFKFKLYKRNNN